MKLNYTVLGVAFLAACLALSYLPFIVGLLTNVTRAVGP
jgi:hypothetical protein